jgi:predicted transposase/invertase (TIGR01784 family)
MPDYHDIFWKLILLRINFAIEFFRFLLKEKAEFLDLENLVSIQEIYYRKKKLLYDILYEIPIRNSNDKLYFLLEHKSRRANDFELQIMKYKHVLHKWQKKEFGKLTSIIPILFYQGLDNWDPLRELEEERKLSNPILSENRQEILIFDLSKIDPLEAFGSPEMRAGMLLLKIISDPWNEFIEGWQKIREILNYMEDSKRVDLEEEMLDYIFKSRLESRELVEEVIMGKQKTMTLYERALEEGIEKGREEGELKNKLDTALKLHTKGFTVYEILEITGLSEDQLRENGIV